MTSGKNLNVDLKLDVSSPGPVKQYLLGIYALLLFLYVAVRANNLSLTYDEIISFETLNGFSLSTMGESANYHILNSLLMKASTALLGDSAFVIRLPNVLAFIIYLFASIKIATLIKPEYKTYILVLLTAMPFLLDFFSLARGYGMGLAFMLLSLCYLLTFCRKKLFVSAIVALFAGMVAVVANFTLLNFFLPLTAILILLIVFSGNTSKNILIKTGLIVILTAGFICLLLPTLLQLKNGGHLMFGGRNNLFHDTICSLGTCFGYFKSYSHVAKIIFIIMFSAAIMIALYHLYLLVRVKKFNVINCLSLLFLGSLLSPLAQHILFQTHYPAERTAIMYYPLMILVLFYGIFLFQNNILNVVNRIIFFLLLTHFIFCLNFKYCYSWRYEAGTKDMLTYLKENHPGNTLLGIEYIRYPSVSFYKSRLNYDSLSVKQVAKAWEYPLELEELNPYYYDAETFCHKNMEFNIRGLIFPGIDYYYVDMFLVEELKKAHVKLEMLKEFAYSRCSLIKIDTKGNQYFNDSINHWMPLGRVDKGEKFIIQAHNKNYLSVTNDHLLVANQTDPLKAEVFEQIDLGNGFSALKTSQGKFVCEDRDAKTGYLYANRDQINEWETFEITYEGFYKVTIKSSLNKYVCGYSPHGDTLTASRDNPGGWETFTFKVIK
ncbi:MAG: hypothetical protein K0S44_32 [Bacteroidetes bacterium]|jgi:hypothetical protein|nr:hypothetical protein [Bacteroidota bacterium]